MSDPTQAASSEAPPTEAPSTEALPDFAAHDAAAVVPALDAAIADNLALLDRIANTVPSWDAVVTPLEAADDLISELFSPLRHLHAVADDDTRREAFGEVLPKLTVYGTQVGQHRGLHAAWRALADAEDFDSWPAARRAAVEQALRGFRLSGIELEGDAQTRFNEIAQRLSELSNRFAQNLLDATDSWSLTVSADRLEGLPESVREQALASAKEAGEDGARFGLDGPTYVAVMGHADDRELRRSFHEAWLTRASDLAVGDEAEARDNTPLMVEMLALRQEQARLLGYGSWAERQLEGRMTEAPEEVLAFLQDLATRSLPQARREYDELCAFARDELAHDDVEPWDVGWISERLRQARFDVSQEALRPWFPVERVLSGLFEIAQRLFDVRIEASQGWSVWHEDVRGFEVYRGDGSLAGRFYLDLFARKAKRGGAWMDGCRGRRRLDDGSVRTPVAFLTCNFAGPVGDRPALLTHDEVTTLFHEFGHGLHHMLTEVDVADVAGISGVSWDAVELPSQFLENWCWHPESVALISAHHETGEPLPTEMLDRLLAARNFQSALAMLRQLEFSLFDFRLHHECGTGVGTDERPSVDADAVRALLAEVRDAVAVIPAPPYSRFENSFGHIFAGGYSAGYYSYKWAEVLSADAFSRFEEEGLFSEAAGRDFREAILARGGSERPAVLFARFRGRGPELEPLLRHSGIATDEEAA